MGVRLEQPARRRDSTHHKRLDRERELSYSQNGYCRFFAIVAGNALEDNAMEHIQKLLARNRVLAHLDLGIQEL